MVDTEGVNAVMVTHEPWVFSSAALEIEASMVKTVLSLYLESAFTSINSFYLHSKVGILKFILPVS